MNTTDFSSLWTSLGEWLQALGIRPGADTVNEIGAQVGAGVNAAASHLDMPSLLALAAALGWASGFRLYAVVFIVGISGWAGWRASARTSCA